MPYYGKGLEEIPSLTGKQITEILVFQSLQELSLQIKADIYSFLSQKEEYSEILGNFLRDAGEKHGEEDWFKQLPLDVLGRGASRGKKEKKKRKKKGKKVPDHWVLFKGMKLSSSIKGEVEIMFETIKDLTEKLDAMEEAKKAVDELKNLGLGNEVNYICFIKDGVLKKIIIKPVDPETVEKFSFSKSFTSVLA